MGSMLAIYPMSAPAQKDLSPAPVRIIAFMPSSAPTISMVLDNSAMTSIFIALRASCLLILIIAISSLGSSCMYFMIDIYERQELYLSIKPYQIERRTTVHLNRPTHRQNPEAQYLRDSLLRFAQ